MVLMAAAKAAGEAAVFPGMTQVVVRVAAAGIVANPIVIVVDVRGVRMIGPITEGATAVLRPTVLSPILLGAIFGCAIVGSALLGRALLRSVCRRPWLGNVASPNILTTTAALASAL